MPSSINLILDLSMWVIKVVATTYLIMLVVLWMLRHFIQGIREEE